MSFKPAKTEALRSFVVLDSEDVLSGLSALDGGAVDELLTRRIDDDLKDRGVQVGGRGASAKANRNRGRKVEEEMRRRRTEHSAAAALIDGLDERQAIGEIDGALDEDVADQLTSGDTIRLRGEVRLHPLHQADAMLRSFIEAAPHFDQAETAAELKQIMPIWNMLIGSGNSARILFDLVTTDPQVPRVLVPVKRFLGAGRCCRCCRARDASREGRSHRPTGRSRARTADAPERAALRARAHRHRGGGRRARRRLQRDGRRLYA